MVQEEKQSKIPHKSLVFGVFFMVCGAALLLFTSGLFPRIIDLWPVLLLVFGLFLLYFVFAKGAYDLYLFPGFLFSLAGLFFLVLHLLPPDIELKRIWPAFMSLTGIALFLYAMALPAGKRITIMVPAGSILLLSLVFLPFSLNLVSFSFLHFFRIWWPAGLLVSGLFLVLENIIRKNK